MAHDAIAFLDALRVGQRVDILGFSIGSFITQELTLRPYVARSQESSYSASAAPKGAAGMRVGARDVIEAVGGRRPEPSGYLRVFFAPSATSRHAPARKRCNASSRRGTATTSRASSRTELAQYDAVCAWGPPENHALLERLHAIDQPVLSTRMATPTR